MVFADPKEIDAVLVGETRLLNDVAEAGSAAHRRFRLLRRRMCRGRIREILSWLIPIKCKGVQSRRSARVSCLFRVLGPWPLAVDLGFQGEAQERPDKNDQTEKTYALPGEG